ncbi:hypothetical protein T484DRAFT_1824275 [Baffinella frigidus]|nr:hypothetical protein T484DRAFT_1824275 [Cryptophyta sp. CCMP2293]
MGALVDAEAPDRHIIDLKDQIKKDEEKIYGFKDQIKKVEEKIYGFKAEGSASTVAASENTLRMHEEKRVYDKIMEKMSYIEGKTRNAREIVDTAESKMTSMEGKTRNAREIVDTAESKVQAAAITTQGQAAVITTQGQAAAITTQGQVAELKAQTAMAMADQRKQQSEKIIKTMADQRKQQSEKIVKDGEITAEENQKLAEGGGGQERDGEVTVEENQKLAEEEEGRHSDGEVTVEENQKLAEEEEDKKEKLMQETMDAIAQKLDAESKELAEEEEDKKEKLMLETMDAIAQKLDAKLAAEAKANMAYSEAHFKAQQGAALLFTAQSKRDKAEKLMESVTRLSALAREAAEVAAAQKIKAQAAAYLPGVQAGAAASYSAGVQAGAVRTVKNPAVTVHVLPHKPANSYLMH